MKKKYSILLLAITIFCLPIQNLALDSRTAIFVGSSVITGLIGYTAGRIYREVKACEKKLAQAKENLAKKPTVEHQQAYDKAKGVVDEAKLQFKVSLGIGGFSALLTVLAVASKLRRHYGAAK